MNKELVKLAKEKYFLGYFPKEWEHHTKEPLRYYFWMCDLQKWLREDCGVFVGVDCDSRGKYRFHIYNVGLPKEGFPKIIGVDETFDFEVGREEYTYAKYEQAMEDGLVEALKLW